MFSLTLLAPCSIDPLLPVHLLAPIVCLLSVQHLPGLVLSQTDFLEYREEGHIGLRGGFLS